MRPVNLSGKNFAELEMATPESSVALVESFEVTDVLSLVLTKKYKHIVQNSSPSRDNELRVAQEMSAIPVDFIKFPICFLLNVPEKEEVNETKSCLISEHLSQVSDKDLIINKIQRLGNSLTGQSSLMNDICTVADELITNAIFNAPFIGVNEFRSGAARDGKVVDIDPNKKPRFFVAVSPSQIFIGCTDFYGTLNATKFLERIQMCYTNGVEQMINFGHGGAGIGCFKIFSATSSLYIGVQSGKMTTICCSFPKNLSGLERHRLKKSTHLEIVSSPSMETQSSVLPFLFFDDFLDGIIITDQQNTVIYANNIAATFLKLKSIKRILNKPIHTHLMPASSEQTKFFVDLQAPNDSFLFHETVVKTATSEEALVAYLAVKKFPGTDNKIIYLRDMSFEISLQSKYSTDKKRLQQALADVETDSLTGCLNKSGILNRLHKRFVESREGSQAFAVIVLDLDGFKKINDTYGHPAGDAYLKAVVQKMRLGLRESDLLGRFGGDEFVSIVETSNRESAVVTAQKLQVAIDSLYVPFEGASLHCTASIGVCLYESEIESFSVMLKMADDCSYISKKSGKNAVCIYPDKATI